MLLTLLYKSPLFSLREHKKKLASFSLTNQQEYGASNDDRIQFGYFHPHSVLVLGCFLFRLNYEIDFTMRVFCAATWQRGFIVAAQKDKETTDKLGDLMKRLQNTTNYNTHDPQNKTNAKIVSPGMNATYKYIRDD